jgi:hypothetical protein
VLVEAVKVPLAVTLIRVVVMELLEAVEPLK